MERIFVYIKASTLVILIVVAPAVFAELSPLPNGEVPAERLNCAIFAPAYAKPSAPQNIPNIQLQAGEVVLYKPQGEVVPQRYIYYGRAENGRDVSVTPVSGRSVRMNVDPRGIAVMRGEWQNIRIGDAVPYRGYYATVRGIRLDGRFVLGSYGISDENINSWLGIVAPDEIAAPRGVSKLAPQLAAGSAIKHNGHVYCVVGVRSDGLVDIGRGYFNDDIVHAVDPRKLTIFRGISPMCAWTRSVLNINR